MLKNIKKSLMLSILLFTFLLNGCATKANFQNTPVNSIEFKKDIKVLESNYSDIKKYSTTSISSSFLTFLTPDVFELKNKWGTPDKEKIVWKTYLFNIALMGGLVAFGQLPFWGLALPFIAVPTPPKTYTWNKENYHINVYTMRSFFSGYTEKTVVWKWKDNKSK